MSQPETDAQRREEGEMHVRLAWPSTSILGLPVHTVQISQVVDQMADWITEGTRPRWIVVADMHAVMEAYRHEGFRLMIATADAIVPDGYSLIWTARRKGIPLKYRVSGADLMQSYFESSRGRATRHFFYGDTQETLALLETNLQRRVPGIQIAGTYSPPFRPLTTAEDERIIAMINAAKADVLWVGLGLPKQERWIFDHRTRVQVPLIIGVGAAFKFLAGTVRRAPSWMGDRGLEWLWRFAKEPRHLWRRVLVDGPQFIGHIALELSGLRKYS